MNAMPIQLGNDIPSANAPASCIESWKADAVGFFKLGVFFSKNGGDQFLLPLEIAVKYLPSCPCISATPEVLPDVSDAS